MSVVLVVVAAVVAGVGAFVALGRRSRRSPDGVAQFQRHIDALSPEARRSVIDRVRSAEQDQRD